MEFIRRTAFAKSDKIFQEFDTVGLLLSRGVTKRGKEPVSVRKKIQN
jgi:hypothetical protein